MASLAETLQPYWVYGLIAFVAAVFLTPLAMRIAFRYGVLDVPDQKLKPHGRPIPYLGGAAICVAWALALVVAMVRGTCDTGMLLPMLLGGVAMALLGLIDDVRSLSPRVRLVVGGAVILLTVVMTGAGTRAAASALLGFNAVFGTSWTLPEPLAWLISVVFAVLVVLGACNSTNLIDGLDGLCSGVTSIISFGFFLLAAHLAVWNYSATGDPVRLVLAIAMAGAALGFLPWNFNPAKIFMGDAGSVLLGYNCGMLILLFAEREIMRWVIGALVIFALPIFDTALAMFRRWRAGRSIFEGDRSHFYDQLVQRGLSTRQTVLVCYGLTLFYAGTGLLMTWVRLGGGPDGQPLPVIRTRWAVLLYVGLVLLSAVAAWRTGLLTPEERRPESPRGSPATAPSPPGS